MIEYIMAMPIQVFISKMLCLLVMVLVTSFIEVWRFNSLKICGTILYFIILIICLRLLML